MPLHVTARVPCLSAHNSVLVRSFGQSFCPDSPSARDEGGCHNTSHGLRHPARRTSKRPGYLAQTCDDLGTLGSALAEFCHDGGEATHALNEVTCLLPSL